METINTKIRIMPEDGGEDWVEGMAVCSITAMVTWDFRCICI